MTDDFTVILPARPFDVAKSRLDLPKHRAEFARAFLLDTISAVESSCRVGHIVVVSPDPVVDRLVDWPVVRDGHVGLNDAIEVGLRWLRAEGRIGATAVLLPDVPALDPVQLDDALETTDPNAPSFVVDAEGLGTTLLASTTLDGLVAEFGSGSANKHRALGYVEVQAALPSARQDVDTLRDLSAAISLGIGNETRRVLRQLVHDDRSSCREDVGGSAGKPKLFSWSSVSRSSSSVAADN